MESSRQLPIPRIANRNFNDANLEILTRVILTNLPSHFIVASGFADPHHGRVCLFSQGTYDGRYGAYIESTPSHHRILVHQMPELTVAKVSHHCFFIRADSFQFHRFPNLIRAIADAPPLPVPPAHRDDSDSSDDDINDRELTIISRMIQVPDRLAFTGSSPIRTFPTTEAWDFEIRGDRIYPTRRIAILEDNDPVEHTAPQLRFMYYDRFSDPDRYP